MMKALFTRSIRWQGGSSQAPPSQQQQGSRPRQPQVEQILHTRYVVNREDLQLFLEQKFSEQSDFAIRVHLFSPSRELRFFFVLGEKKKERKR